MGCGPDGRFRGRKDDAGMASYSVIWDDSSDCEAGRLDVEPHGIRFEGISHSHTVFFEDIESVHVGRAPAERLRGRPSLVLDRHAGRPVRIGSLDGLGSLNELAGMLGRLTATPLSV
jgi:hypothetical protein